MYNDLLWIIIILIVIINIILIIINENIIVVVGVILSSLHIISRITIDIRARWQGTNWHNYVNSRCKLNH